MRNNDDFSLNIYAIRLNIVTLTALISKGYGMFNLSQRLFSG